MVEKVLVQCFKCRYTWKTRSQMIFVSCPSCNSKNRIRVLVEEEDDHGTTNSGEINN